MAPARVNPPSSAGPPLRRATVDHIFSERLGADPSAVASSHQPAGRPVVRPSAHLRLHVTDHNCLYTGGAGCQDSEGHRACVPPGPPKGCPESALRPTRFLIWGAVLWPTATVRAPNRLDTDKPRLPCAFSGPFGAWDSHLGTPCPGKGRGLSDEETLCTTPPARKGKNNGGKLRSPVRLGRCTCAHSPRAEKRA